jgi:uncharacterized protein (TIGR02996 family)
VSDDDDDVHPLTLALEAARAADHAATLRALLAAWADAPAPRIADLIDVVGAAVAPDVPAELWGDEEAAAAAWLARATARDPADVPALIATLTTAPIAIARPRLVALGALRPDPRIDAAIVKWCAQMPFLGSGSQHWWGILLGQLATVRDARQLPVIRTLTHTVAATVRAQRLSELILARLALLPELIERLEAPVAAPPIVADLERALATVGAKPPDTLLPELLRAVHEAPDDDAPRMVYADALLERQDARGELIQNQLRGAPPTPREKKLVAGLRKAILGDLAAVVTAPVIERGFLARCTVDPLRTTPDELRRLAGHAAWATVHDLEGSAIIGLHEVMRLRAWGFDGVVAEQREGLVAPTEDLLAGRPRSLEELRMAVLFPDHRPADLALLQSCRALPRLRRLVLRPRGQVYPFPPDAFRPIATTLAAAPVLSRLERLVFAMPFHWSLASFGAVFEAARAREVEIAWPTASLVVHRGTMSYERATVILDGSSGVERLFADLPHTIRAIVLQPRRAADRAAAEQLRVVLARRPGITATVEL